MWTITSTCSFNTCAIAEEDALAAVLPTLAPIVESSTTLLVTFEEGPDLTTVDGRSTVGVDSAPIDEFTLVAATLPGSDAVCSTMIEGLAEATPPVERQSNSLLNEEQSASLHAGIQALEVEVEMLKKSKYTQFRIEHICGDDKLVEFYTGFRCYAIFLAFFKFLGPAVNHLNYWGCNVSEYPQKQKRMMKIDPMNQLFMTLMKLRINLKTLDLVLLIWNLCKCCFKMYNYLNLFHVPSAEGD